MERECGEKGKEWQAPNETEKKEREEMKVKKKKKKIELGKNQRQREGCSWGREGHVLLNEDFHQVDVAAGGRGMQGRPQLVVLGVHIGTVGKEQLDNFLKVVNAALQGGHRQGQLPAGPWVVTRAHQVPRREATRRTAEPSCLSLNPAPLRTCCVILGKPLNLSESVSL